MIIMRVLKIGVNSRNHEIRVNVTLREMHRLHSNLESDVFFLKMKQSARNVKKKSSCNLNISSDIRRMLTESVLNLRKTKGRITN